MHKSIAAAPPIPGMPRWPECSLTSSDLHHHVYARSTSINATETRFDARKRSGDPSELLTGLAISNGDRVTGWAGANRQTAINSDAALDLDHW